MQGCPQAIATCFVVPSQRWSCNQLLARNKQSARKEVKQQAEQNKISVLLGNELKDELDGRFATASWRLPKAKPMSTGERPPLFKYNCVTVLNLGEPKLGNPWGKLQGP